MSRTPITVRSINIQTMPGFLNGGFKIDRLASRVNIIYGPNGIGKSTTARAIEEAFWQGTVETCAIAVQLEADQDNWLINQNGLLRTVQRNGQPADFPSIPSAEMRDRYRLAFTDLISAKNTSLAQHIVRELMGGYDIGQAISDLGYHPNIADPRKIKNEYETARRLFEQATDAQRRLRNEELIFQNSRIGFSRLKAVRMKSNYYVRLSTIRIFALNNGRFYVSLDQFQSNIVKYTVMKSSVWRI